MLRKVSKGSESKKLFKFVSLNKWTYAHPKLVQISQVKDQGRHNLSPIYDKLIQNNIAMGLKDGSEGTDF